jgi:uncharacterized membrane protein YphA (DoxX/SURF4 family)
MGRARTSNSIAAWVLSVFLAGVFIAAGIPKLTGGTTPWLQAAAMHGFPAWMRIVVGIFEVAGGLALLIRPLAIYGAIGLAVLMIPATITQGMSGEPGLYVPVVLLVLLVVLGWLRDPTTVRELYRGVAVRPGPILREGAVAGIIGASAVALWFFVVDIVAGHPLFTPQTLGDALFTVVRSGHPVTLPAAVAILAYTIFHYAAFIAVGIAVSDVIAWSGREPALLLGFVILFVAFEVGFYGFAALLQHASPLGDLAWSQVMAGNIIAAASMGVYLWRAHPRLHERFAHALD